MATKSGDFAKTGAIWGAILGTLFIGLELLAYGIAAGFICGGPLHVILGIVIAGALGAATGALILAAAGAILGLFFHTHNSSDTQQTGKRRFSQEPQQDISQQQEPDTPQQNQTQFQDLVTSKRGQQTVHTPT